VTALGGGLARARGCVSPNPAEMHGVSAQLLERVSEVLCTAPLNLVCGFSLTYYLVVGTSK
jgi:hypothetical protein